MRKNCLALSAIALAVGGCASSNRMDDGPNQPPGAGPTVTSAHAAMDRESLRQLLDALDKANKNIKDSTTKLSESAGQAAGKAITDQTSKAKADLEKAIKNAKDLADQLNTVSPVDCKNLKPAIYNIGQGSILVFDRTETSSVRIPIDGRDLYPDCVNFSMTITGDVPLKNACSIDKTHAQNYNNGNGEDIPFDREECHVSTPGHTSSNNDKKSENAHPKPSSPDIANLVLKHSYLKRLQTHDKITIQISISEKNGTSSAGCKEDTSKCRKIAYATRSFTMYELNDFRNKVKSTRIDIRDINAFPLTGEETRDLFGPVIDRLYYAVRLSVSNQTGAAKLINTGMIRVEGRAIVEPDKETDEPIYTIPVTVVPQSLQHVYSIVDGTEGEQARAWVFRGLEFVGALGTAINALGPVTRATANMGLFTGVAIPETKKLWPDAVPTYRKNIVDYAMPDLLKVSANSQTGHKYLFFSKKDIETVVSNPQMYLRDWQDCVFDGSNAYTNCLKRKINRESPKARVISLAFDHMDIRFDNVTDITTDTAKADLLRLIVELPKYLDGDYKQALGTNKQMPTPTLTEAQFANVLPDGVAQDDQQAFNNVKKDIIATLSGAGGTLSFAEAMKILENSKKYGKASLEQDLKTVNALAGAYGKGEDLSLHAKELDGISTDLKTSKQIFDLSASLREDVNALKILLDKSKEKKYTKDNVKSALIAPLQDKLATINSSLSNLKELDSAK